MRKHTAKPVQRVSCPVRGCKKTYSSKCALQQHTRDDHNPPSVIVCDFIDKDGKVCGKESKTKTLPTALHRCPYPRLPGSLWRVFSMAEKMQ